jgi:hypothetical protein
MKQNGRITHSMLVMGLTCPSRERMGERVSRSQISRVPDGRAAATKRPEESNLASVAVAKSEVWIAVGWEMLKKGSEMWELDRFVPGIG